MGQLLLNSLITGSLYSLVTIGFALTYNTGRFFNLAHGAVFVIGGYTGYVAYRILHLDLALSLTLSTLFSGLSGIFIHDFIFRRLTEKKAPGLVLFISSLGILIVTEGLIAMVFGNEIIVFRQGPSPIIRILGGYITILQGEILVLAAIFFTASYLFFKKTNVGKQIRAVSDDRELAATVGIPVRAILSHIFFWGSALAGMAGTLMGLEQSIRPGSGMIAILWATVASIVGGVGSFAGPILGAFLLGIVENLAVSIFPSEWKSTVVFSTLIFFFFFRSTGIWGVRK